MKKILSIIFICCITVIFVSCNNDNSAADEISESSEASETIKSEKEESRSQLEERDRETDTGKQHVFDEAKLLNESGYDDLNTYAAWLSKAFKINTAIVITDDIDKNSPHDYAENYYNDLYSGDGILMLINNDTNEDYFYRSGIPAKFITEETAEILINEISPLLALENYTSAVEKTLETAELLLPEYFTDRSGTLKKEEIEECNTIIKDAAEKSNLNIYYVNGTGEDSLEDFAKSRFKMFYDDSANIAMLVINGENGKSYLCTSGSMTYMNDKKSEIESAIKSCYKKNSGMDIKSAVEKFIEFVE